METVVDPQCFDSSVGRPVLAREDPLAPRAKCGLKIIVGIGHFINPAPVADLEISDILVGAIDEVMCRAASREAETHPGLEMLLAIVRHRHNVALENIDELILRAVAVEESR